MEGREWPHIDIGEHPKYIFGTKQAYFTFKSILSMKKPVTYNITYSITTADLLRFAFMNPIKV